MAFVGLRIAGAVAVLAASGAIAGALIAYGFEGSDKRASAELEHNLDARVEAGRTALAAILEADAESQKRDAQLTEAKKAAAEARARELVLLARTAGDLGEVQLAANESLELVDSAVDQPSKALELGPPREDGKRIAARVGYATSTPANAALARALGAIVNLGDAPKPLFPPESKVWIFLLCALASAFVAFAYARVRIGGPLQTTLDRARALAHGNMVARADENRGSRDARDLARAVNALVDRAERLKSQGREARDEDVSHLVRAIEALAKGELGSPIPNVGDALSPLARALDRTSRDLLERVRSIRDLASDMAERASEVGPAAKKIGAAALEQAETLSGIGATAQEAATEVRNSRERLAQAIDAMERGAAAERKVAQELRTALLAAKRRLDTARLPVGDLGALEEEMKEAAASLDAIAASLPEAPPSVDSAVTGNLTAAAAGLVRIAETIARGLRVLERSSHASFEGADQLRRIVGDSTQLATRLGSVLAGFAAGTSFEEELLERLERWQEEAKLAAISPDGLTDEGRVLVRQVIESSEGVRARLARMVSATESAIDVLRR